MKTISAAELTDLLKVGRVLKDDPTVDWCDACIAFVSKFDFGQTFRCMKCERVVEVAMAQFHKKDHRPNKSEEPMVKVSFVLEKRQGSTFRIINTTKNKQEVVQ